MSTVYHIVDVPLPLNQDFNELKELGLEYIQKHSGNNWSNLNTSDPGITILDQLCYALTELGYVNNFPVQDILTRRDGKLEIKDQFYLPEEILTTSPITQDDYRKYIIDGVAGVKNVLVVPGITGNTALSGAYRIYLQVDESMIVSNDVICNTVAFYLNKRRNLNEFFLQPAVLHKELHLAGGIIEIENAADLTKILTEISNQVRNFIFPDVEAVSYDALNLAGVPTNDIFNGPLLVHGWIPTDALGTKKDTLQVFELLDLINAVPGVISVSGLNITPLVDPSEIVYLPEAKVYTLEIFRSFYSGTLEVYSNGNRILPLVNITPASQGKSLKANTSIQYGAAMNVKAELPKGRFRDIDTYYSIQNTFPEIYAVGADAVDSDAPDYVIAQSRQLKGYLTLFDQVLANQFSQLANLDRLFSFKNAVTEDLHDLKRRHHRYPVPYKTFAPTYFYQPLYDVPHIRPLLKNNDAFNFSVHVKPEKIQEQKSWKRYMLDPYNPYIRGLMDFVEDEKNSLSRRNEILDHLLARNGESPYVINEVIDPLLYAGDVLKGQIIFKSLYLQNLGLLSYYRPKAYNYLGAIKIAEGIPEVSPDFEEQILGGNTIDFIFRSGKIDWIEKVRVQDFINYSTAELKLSLLFGLRIVYLNYIAANYDIEKENIALAQWMIRQRRGVIAIETGLLFQFGNESMQDLKTDPAFENQLLLFFPSFVPAFKDDQFDNRLDLFFQSSLPVEVPGDYYFIGTDELTALIILFTAWHNELVYSKDKDYVTNPTLAASAEQLASHIKTINDRYNAGNG